MQSWVSQFFAAKRVPGLGALCALLAFATLPGCIGNNESEASKNSRVAGNPQVQFQGSSVTTIEGAGSVQIAVVLTKPTQATSTVTYTVTSGTAVNSIHFSTPSSGTFTIAGGSTVTYLTIPLVDDGSINATRSFSLSLGTTRGNLELGANRTFTVNIDDDDALATVNFSTSAQTVSESVGLATVTAQITSARTYAISIPLSVSGTAVVGVDYAALPATLDIPAGSTSGSISVTIINEGLIEPSKTIVITMDDPGTADLGTITEQEITITNDGGVTLPTVAFSSASQTVTEAAGTVTVTVDLSGASPVTTTVPFSLSNSTALGAGDDYIQVTPSPLVFAPGETSKNITFTVVDDAVEEPSETIVVDLGEPTNASLGATETHVVTITDNEAPSFSITGVSPVQGPIEGGNRVTIYGTGLDTVTDVTISGVPCTPLTLVNQTELNCVAGAGAAGAGDVVLTDTTPTNATLVGAYTYLPWVATNTVGAPAARRYHTAVWTGYEMIIWGGFDGVTYYNDGYRFNPVTNAWSAVTTTGAPTAREGHTAVWTGSEMVVWGGDNGSPASAFSTGAHYNPITNTWPYAVATTNAPAARTSHTAVWAPTGEMIIWGGRSTAALNSGRAYNTVTRAWGTTTITTTGAPAARYFHTAVMGVANGLYRMIIWGGTNGASDLSTGGMYNLATGTWAATSATGVPAARQGHTAVWTGGQMIVYGGLNNNVALAGGSRFVLPSTHIAGGTWSALPTTSAPTARSNHSAVWTGDEMIIWGGSNGSAALNDGGRFNVASNAWSDVDNTTAPTARYDHTAIFTGSRMLVWGGYDASATGTGSVYYVPRPKANSWSSVVATAAPTARRYHTAVWTGSEMIIWGGDTNIATPTCTNTGARYNPVTNAWSATSTTSQVARCDHSAVWTGGRMIVWGGRSSVGTALATGAVYNPVANTWTTTSTTSAPSSRMRHTAVWTGSEMIVWGGVSGTTLRGDGARYNLSTNAWSAVTATGAPAARNLHTAVWTGSQMIVWGGNANSAGGAPLNTGGRYTPGGAWTATATGSAPVARDGHTAIWTGSRMIIWGGFTGASRVNTGALYDPVGDAWVATSTTNAAAGRSNHTAVWTGEQMLVWGGFSGSSQTSSGSAYNPATDLWSTFTLPVSVTPAVPARWQHTAVWTGSRMIIWGGSTNTSLLSSGGQFAP